MANRLRAALRPWVPPRVVDLMRRATGYSSSLEIRSQSWETLHELCAGYGDPLILDSVERATKLALGSDYAFERDGILFDEPEVHWPVLGALLAGRSRREGALRVLDMGGSLASKWIQLRPFRPLLAPIAWAVVEQSSYVDRARPLLESAELTFHTSANSAAEVLGEVDVVLFSSSLQYFPDPYGCLDDVITLGPDVLMIDRVPTCVHDKDQVGLQTTGLYGRRVQYPSWLLGRSRLVHRMESAFELTATWDEPLGFPVRPRMPGESWLGVIGIGLVK